MKNTKKLTEAQAAHRLIRAVFGERDDEDLLYVCSEEQVQVINNALTTLSGREAAVIVCRFGFHGQHCSTLQECGELFGVTRERIRQIETQALRKLRHPLRSGLRKRHEEEVLDPTTTPLEDLELSVRTYNCLRRHGYEKVADIIALSDDELLKVRNLGKREVEEIKAKIEPLKSQG